jgi:hypothetical protein
MTEPSADGPQRSTLIAVGIGFLVGIVLVLSVFLDMGLLEIGLILLPIVGVTALAGFGLLWAERRGNL